MSAEYKLTEQEEQDYIECTKYIHEKIEHILTRARYIARVIARLQPGDIEMTQCLRFIIDAFTAEAQSYKEFLEEEKEKMNDSLTKFRVSVCKEIGFENESRSIN